MTPKRSGFFLSELETIVIKPFSMMSKLRMTDEGMKPFIHYKDMQDFVDALDDKTMQRWSEIIMSNGEHKDAPHLMQAALAIYFKEMQIDSMPDDDHKILEIVNSFIGCMASASMTRDGMMQQVGRLKLTNPDSAQFVLTDQGNKKQHELFHKVMSWQCNEFNLIMRKQSKLSRKERDITVQAVLEYVNKGQAVRHDNGDVELVVYR